jgi:hypothetical protein
MTNIEINLKRSFSQQEIMNTKVLFVGLVSMIATSALGQSFSVDWSKVSGGGGVSTGSVYSVSGTVGQHDAARQSQGGNYSVIGGFWSFLAIQAAGAPLLTIRQTVTNTAVVYWPSPSTGWNLQQNSDLANANSWVSPSESVSDNGQNKFIIAQPVAGARFYRLFKP